MTKDQSPLHFLFFLTVSYDLNSSSFQTPGSLSEHQENSFFFSCSKTQVFLREHRWVESTWEQFYWESRFQPSSWAWQTYEDLSNWVKGLFVIALGKICCQIQNVWWYVPLELCKDYPWDVCDNFYFFFRSMDIPFWDCKRGPFRWCDCEPFC